MKNKKGFTLIELLAVIVILGVIMAIAIPSVTHLITKSKRDAAVVSGQGYVDAIDKESAAVSMGEGELASEGIYDVSYFTSKVTLNGSKPTAGTVTIDEEGSVVSANLCINNILVNYANKVTTTTGIKCTTTMKTYANGTTVYYNPVTGNICTLVDYTANTGASNNGTKTGCMKWYTFNDGETSTSTINMILDHNTTAQVVWNSTGSNSAMKEVATALNADTSSWTSGLNPRLITATEIATITGYTGWTTSSTWYYFASKTITQLATCTSPTFTGCTYTWLYDRTSIDSATTYGALNNASSTTNGYWTSSANASDSTNAWFVFRVGSLSNYTVSITDRGVRPVITISKLII